VPITFPFTSVSLLVEPLPMVAVNTLPTWIGLPKLGPFSTYVEVPPVVLIVGEKPSKAVVVVVPFSVVLRRFPVPP